MQGIFALQINESVSYDANVIENHVVDFFSNVFCPNTGVSSNTGVSLIKDIVPSLVLNSDNSEITRCPSFDEIKKCAFMMDPHSAPGPDGFTSLFFRSFRDIVGSDVCNVV